MVTLIKRLEKSVVGVQAMFRSNKAQQDYRRMKLAHEEDQLEYDGMKELDQIATVS
ncbi:unnamed protein product [Brassica oleracea]|nr:hypothetical protein F2Q69_00056767 [Brassica cretica]